MFLISVVVALGALIELTSLLRGQASRQPQRVNLAPPVLPPNLARDPFINTPPKPAPLIKPRPSVRGEAAIAAVAIGAYLAVFGVSLFGGGNTPDLLNVRGSQDTSQALAAEVLSAQTTSTAFAEPAIPPSPPEAAEPQATPAEATAVEAAPEPEPEPEPPAQHILRTGETLTSVAALYGVTVYDLATANALTTDRVLAGQVLKIPR
jgi:LysM repeat protein